MRGEVCGCVLARRIMSPPPAGLFQWGQISAGAVMHVDWDRFVLNRAAPPLTNKADVQFGEWSQWEEVHGRRLQLTYVAMIRL